MSITLFPFSLVRYPSLDYRELDPFRASHLVKEAKAYKQRSLTLHKDRLTFCDQLFEVIRQFNNDSDRQQLINLRRKIYNQKALTPDELIFLRSVLSSDLISQLDKLLSMVQEFNLFISTGQQSFDCLLGDHRRLLQHLTESQALQNGMLLSSPVIYDELSRFRSVSPASFGQKQFRMEFSVMKYLTRMAFKTSPFSTFTYTGLALLGEKKSSEVGASHVTSTVRLNNTLFNYLESLMQRHPILVGCLMVKLNETVTERDKQLSFMLNYFNVEAFQTLNNNGMHQQIVQVLKAKPYGIHFSELLEQLAGYLDENERPALKAYLLKLNAAGLFKIGFNMTSIDLEWDAKLQVYLESITPAYPEARPIVDLLQKLECYKLSYPRADTAERHRLLRFAETEVNRLFSQLQTEAGIPISETRGQAKLPLANSAEFFGEQFTAYRFEAKHIFFEDCATDRKEVLPADQLQEFTTKVDRLLNSLRPFDPMAAERRKMRGFFLKHHLPEAEVSLYDFYRTYYTEIKKPEKQLREDTGAVDISAEITDWEKSLKQRFKTILTPGIENVNIPLNFFDEMRQETSASQTEIAPLPSHYSRGLFVQFFQGCKEHKEQEDRVFGVINAVLPGMGKVPGRFLPLFDANVAKLQAEWNQKLYPEILKIELSDTSSFNANMHPPLLTYELALPGSNNLYPSNQQIHINQLTIRYDAEKDSLGLYFQDREVFAFDLSLESYYNRSNLYQMLAHCNLESRSGVDQLIGTIDRCLQNDQGLADTILLPRICFDETVILRRKCWMVKTSSIPIQTTTETEYEYFLRLNNWRLQQGLPCRLFIFLRKRVTISKTEETAGRADDYKPQYLSFEMPLSVTMFKRLLKRAGSQVWFEEMQPDPFTDRDLNAGHDVKEYLVQWYKI